MFCYETKISGIKLLRRISCHMLVVKGLVKVYNMLQMIFNRELSEGGTSNHSLWFCSPTLQTPPPPSLPILINKYNICYSWVCKSVQYSANDI